MRSKLTVEYHHVLDFDDVPVRGNTMASGDDAFDREVEEEILQRMDRGDVAAWALAQVHATLEFDVNGEELFQGIGETAVGPCSYGSTKELWESVLSNYNLRGDALDHAADDLRRQLTSPGLLRRFERDLKKLEREETHTWLLERQAKATSLLATNPEWAAQELVHIDAELEKL